MNVFIDDERHPPESWKESYVVIRNMKDFKQYVEKFGCPTFISFDHDLGDNEPTGHDIVKFMVEKDLNMNGKFIPVGFKWRVHSQNPVGAWNISHLLNNYIMSRNKTTGEL